MVRRRDIKKSSFVSVDDSETNDTFDFVRNGQNLKISQADLITALGLTGELQTRGEATAVPVLRIIAGVNYIRNILGGAGINAQVSAQDGIEISHNFTVDGTGVPIMINEGADSPTLRSIQAGGGISVSGAGGIVQISTTGTPASTKTVLVYSISDFPAPVGDYIQLEDNTEYKLGNDVSSSYRYVMGSNTVLSGADGALIELEYTGSGNMITAVDKYSKIKDLMLSCATATLLSISSTTNLHHFVMHNCNVFCNNIGTLDNIGFVSIFNTYFKQVYSNGMYFLNNFGVFLFTLSGIQIPSGSGSAFVLGTSTFDYFVLDKATFGIFSTGYIISGAANSANINAGGLGLISASRNFGTGGDPPTDNIFPSDDRWESQHNSKLPDSLDIALGTYGGGTINIVTTGVPVKVGATWTAHKEYRFTVSSDGIFTYNGNQSEIEITASITAEPFVGTDSIGFYLYKNGVQIPQSLVTATVTNGEPQNMMLIWDEYLETSDYLEIYAVNIDTNVDVEISKIAMKVRS